VLIIDFYSNICQTVGVGSFECLWLGECPVCLISHGGQRFSVLMNSLIPPIFNLLLCKQLAVLNINLIPIIVREDPNILTLSQLENKIFLCRSVLSLGFQLAKSSSFFNNWSFKNFFNMRLGINTRYFNAAVVWSHLPIRSVTFHVSMSKLCLRVEINARYVKTSIHRNLFQSKYVDLNRISSRVQIYP
jgi:hypothetical protein